MGTQYFCSKKERAGLVRDHATLNGIDYLEVLDEDAPAGSPVQQTLLVHCFRQVSMLSEANVRILGGVRITYIGVTWAFQASAAANAFASGIINAAERDLVLGLTDAANTLVVRTDSNGDFSTYILQLVTSTLSSNPPAGFDPVLSEVDFSFKAECPADFDCLAAPACPPELLAEPQIDYLAKDYASFRRLMFDRLSTTMPEWAERNTADVGVAMVEALAYAADQLSYYQDAVGTEAYLDTARERVSVRRHAKLLDYRLHEGVNARVWVVFEVEAGRPADGGVLRAGTPLLTQTSAPAGVLPADALASAVNQGAQVFETMHDAHLHAGAHEMLFHTWGDEDCCLPKGATKASLKNTDHAFDFLKPGDVLIFEEVLGTVTGLKADADPAHRVAVRLTKVTPAEDPLHSPAALPVLNIEWHPQDALPFALCLSAHIGGALQVQNDMAVARGNVVLADHGRTLTAENLNPKKVAEGRYRPRLPRNGVTYRIEYAADMAPGRPLPPARGALLQDPRSALPAVFLDDAAHVGDDGWQWRPVVDLLSSSRFVREFVVETENDGRAHLRFGDGILGQQPTPCTTLVATYRIGNGSAGNVGADTITHVITPLDGVVGLRNPLPAQGGVAPEALQRVRLDAPQAFRVQERAVTAEDYAMVAQRHPEVQKAAATLRWTGSWYTMFVTVDRFGGLPVDAAFESDLAAFLETYRLAGYDLEIEGPVFVPLDIGITVCVKPGYFRSAVRMALLQAFSSGTLPGGGGRGFFHPDNFTFGDPVYLSAIVATAMQVPGVLWVDVDSTPPKSNRFQRWGRAPLGELAAGRIAMGRLEIARLDNDVNRPENGRLEFFMEDGL